MPRITLYEHAPTRSARCRWTLLEAGLDFDSVGNPSDFIDSEEFAAIHPLSKLPRRGDRRTSPLRVRGDLHCRR